LEPIYPAALKKSGGSQANLAGKQPPTRSKTGSSSVRPKPKRALTQAYTPRSEKEDPFNLGTFYSSVLGSPDQEQQWSWLRDADNEEEGADDDEDTDDLGTRGIALDRDLVVIEKEDKLGVLSLGEITFLSSRVRR
jgi:hypothetical protein